MQYLPKMRTYAMADRKHMVEPARSAWRSPDRMGRSESVGISGFQQLNVHKVLALQGKATIMEKNFIGLVAPFGTCGRSSAQKSRSVPLDPPFFAAFSRFAIPRKYIACQ
ncbi:MAG TPA: hypothetical protein PLB89_10295 [Flavobacteriales bacterium]|nr:hypothetical protein [Flavobacteriales bacterium]